jgi:hypothetical protein
MAYEFKGKEIDVLWLVRENRPTFALKFRVAVLIPDDEKEDLQLDIREYIKDAGEGRPFDGFTRRGVRLHRSEVIDLFKNQTKIMELMGITEDDIRPE